MPKAKNDPEIERAIFAAAFVKHLGMPPRFADASDADLAVREACAAVDLYRGAVAAYEAERSAESTNAPTR